MSRDLEALHPNEPWLWKRDWAASRIEDENRNSGWFLLFFGLFWNAITGGMSWAIWHDAGPRGPQHLFVLLFPAIGTVVLIAAIHGLLRRRRYGVAVFELATLPAPPGRALAGHVLVTTGLHPDREMSIRLRCLRRQVTGSGKNRKTHETTLWEDQWRIPGAIRAGEGVKIPVAIPIPSDALPTDERDSSNRVLWRLEVRSETSGVDFFAQFEVPVFRTEESNTPFTPEELTRFT